MPLLKLLFKSQRAPRYRHLLWFWLSWSLFLLIILTTLLIHDGVSSGRYDHPHPATIWDSTIRDYQGVPWEAWAMLLGVAMCIGVIHSFVLRLFPSKNRLKVTLKETTIISSLLLITIVTIYSANHHLQLKNAWLQEVSQYELAEELELIINHGDFDLAVKKMEDSMATFNHAKKMLGGTLDRVDMGVSGISQIYMDAYKAWPHTNAYIPTGMQRFLQIPSHMSEHQYYKSPKWQKTGEAMCRSEDPLIRAFGLILTEDKEIFRKHVYKEASAGNQAFYGLAICAAEYIDSDPARAFHTVAPFWEEFDTESSYQYDITIYNIGNKAETSGVNLGIYKDNFRRVLISYHHNILSSNTPRLDDDELIEFTETLKRHNLTKEQNSIEKFIAKKNKARLGAVAE